MKLIPSVLAILAGFALSAAAQNANDNSNGAASSDQKISPPVSTGPKLSADKVGDGVDQGSAEIFDTLDANKDGMLTRDEFMRMPSLSGAPTGSESPAATNGASTQGTTNANGTNNEPGADRGAANAASPANPQR
jgi:hypothetical protein